MRRSTRSSWSTGGRTTPPARSSASWPPAIPSSGCSTTRGAAWPPPSTSGSRPAAVISSCAPTCTRVRAGLRPALGRGARSDGCRRYRRSDATDRDDAVRARVAAVTSSRIGMGNGAFHFVQARRVVDTVFLGCYRTATPRGLGGWDEDRLQWGAEDHELNFRLTRSGGQIVCDPHITSWYFRAKTPWALWRQYFNYGVGKVSTLSKHRTLPSSLSARARGVGRRARGRNDHCRRHEAAVAVGADCGMGRAHRRLRRRHGARPTAWMRRGARARWPSATPRTAPVCGAA